MEKGRVRNSKRNILSGIIKQFINIVLAFVVRTVLIYVLGAEYQGLTGLFTSILHVLNLSDLGFSTAVIFLLYKPIAENNTEIICSIINHLKKIYFVIGVVILSAGICIMPFLRYLVLGDIPEDVNIYVLFLIYLINSSISYMLFAYKSALLTAMQRQDIENNIYTISMSAIKILQIVLLLLFRNYYIYIIVLPIGTIINNILLQIASSKVFPQIVPRGEIPQNIKDEFNKQIKAVFLGKIGDVARNSFDNIVISALFGLVAVAIYDNYFYIYNAIYGIMGIVIRGISASVGNSIAIDSKEKNYADLLKFNFIFMWITGWFSICMACLYQPFMMIWMKGNQTLLLTDPDMLLFCFYFYSINMTYVRSMYLDGNGLFYECRIWFIIEAIGNLVLNFTLGYLFGITGIILATIITILLFNFISRTQILFKKYFMKTPKEFYRHHILYMFITMVVGLICYMICRCVSAEGVLGVVIRASICCVIPNVLYFVFYRRFSQFSIAKNLVLRIFSRNDKE